ncbi:MAG TPA: hypothetical protein ENI15_10740 [Spirochaetes bacterium]|nr:hypothetical protein [Spirochaetota bacterium]
MSLDLENAVIERNKITYSFPVVMEKSLLISTDRTDHRFWIQKVYKSLLHENCVIDECDRRFENTFRSWN